MDNQPQMGRPIPRYLSCIIIPLQVVNINPVDLPISSQNLLFWGIKTERSAVVRSAANRLKKLVKSKYDDGQLDECPLNRRELMQIEQAFLKVYERMNHDRVAYPEEKKK